MKFQTAIAFLVVAAATPAAVTIAADPATKPATATAGKGLRETHTVEKTATITALDAAKRLATLTGADGSQFQVEASPEVTNFDKLKVGDKVVATYTQSLGVRIESAAHASPGVKETVIATPATGQARTGREVTATLKVESVDAANNMVTLSDGAGHSAPVDVVDPRARERLKTLRPGEMVVITYTEALALRLEKVAPK